MLSYKRVGLATGLTVSVWHIFGYLYMYFFFADNELWAQIFPLMHPGGQWLTWSGFFIGLIEAFFFGLVLAWVFVAFYNWLKD